MPRIVDWPARMREVAEFVGLGSAELDVVQATAPVVLKHGEALTAAVYDHFLKFDGSRSFFLGKMERLTSQNWSGASTACCAG